LQYFTTSKNVNRAVAVGAQCWNTSLPLKSSMPRAVQQEPHREAGGKTSRDPTAGNFITCAVAAQALQCDKSVGKGRKNPWK
jgi:hypothetical protein